MNGTPPQDVALADAIKGVNMFQKVNIDILGIIENMSTYVCSKCGHEEHIFSHQGGQKTADRMKVSFLGEIPLELETRIAGDEGTPIVIRAPQSAQAKRFLEIASSILKKAENIQPKMPAMPSLENLQTTKSFDV